MNAFAAAALAVAAAPAAARTADYSLADERYEALAADLGVRPFPKMPTAGEAQLTFEGDAVDHKMTIAGIFCSAWKVDNPISQMVKRSLIAWDADGSLGESPGAPLQIRVRLDRASSNMRCVEVKELKTRCLLRTALGGTATIETAGEAPRTAPLSVHVEQQQSMSGACNGLAQGTSLLGRAASIALIERLREITAE